MEPQTSCKTLFREREICVALPVLKLIVDEKASISLYLAKPSQLLFGEIIKGEGELKLRGLKKWDFSVLLRTPYFLPHWFYHCPIILVLKTDWVFILMSFSFNGPWSFIGWNMFTGNPLWSLALQRKVSKTPEDLCFSELPNGHHLCRENWITLPQQIKSGNNVFLSHTVKHEKTPKWFNVFICAHGTLSKCTFKMSGVRAGILRHSL